MRVQKIAIAATLLVVLSSCSPQAPEPEAAPIQGSVTIEVNAMTGMLTPVKFKNGQSCAGLHLKNSAPPSDQYVVKDQGGETIASGEWDSKMSYVTEPYKTGLCTFVAKFEAPADTTFIQVLSGDFDKTFPSDEFAEGAAVRLHYNE